MTILASRDWSRYGDIGAWQKRLQNCVGLLMNIKDVSASDLSEDHVEILQHVMIFAAFVHLDGNKIPEKCPTTA